MRIHLLCAVLIVVVGSVNVLAAILISNAETLVTFDVYPATNDWRTVSVGVDIATVPRMRIARTTTNGVELSWHASWTNVFVGVTSTFPPTSWEPVVQPLVISNGQARLTLPHTNDRRFFRLRE